MSPVAYIKKRYKLIGERTVSSLNKRFFDAYYVDTKKEALEKALELIPKRDTISWGGSLSVVEIGLIDYLLKNKYEVINRDKAQTPEEKKMLLKKALLCDTYLMGSNAISEKGELVNIDHIGNRTASLMFGPKSVIIIAGANKISPTLEDAIQRARNCSATTNIQRIAGSKKRQTPCFCSGICHDCISKDSICSHILITRLCTPEKRIKVIIVGEDLGF